MLRTCPRRMLRWWSGQHHMHAFPPTLNTPSRSSLDQYRSIVQRPSGMVSASRLCPLIIERDDTHQRPGHKKKSMIYGGSTMALRMPLQHKNRTGWIRALRPYPLRVDAHQRSRTKNWRVASVVYLYRNPPDTAFAKQKKRIQYHR